MCNLIHLNCIMQLKQFYNIAIKVSSRKKVFLFLVIYLTVPYIDHLSRYRDSLYKDTAVMRPMRQHIYIGTPANVMTLWPLIGHLLWTYLGNKYIVTSHKNIFISGVHCVGNHGRCCGRLLTKARSFSINLSLRNNFKNTCIKMQQRKCILCHISAEQLGKMQIYLYIFSRKK